MAQYALQRLDHLRMVGDGVEIHHVEFHRLIEVGIAGAHIYLGQIHGFGSLAQLLGAIDPCLFGGQPLILLDDPGPGLAETDGLCLRRPQHGTQQTRPE